METKTDTPNNNAQQPAAPVAPKEPSWGEEAWAATKVIAASTTVNFIHHFAVAAGVTLGACVVLKCFGAFDQKAAE